MVEFVGTEKLSERKEVDWNDAPEEYLANGRGVGSLKAELGALLAILDRGEGLLRIYLGPLSHTCSGSDDI